MHRSWRLRLTTVCLLLTYCCAAVTSAKAQDDDEAPLPAGLQARYALTAGKLTADKQPAPLFVRSGVLPAFALNAGETPDPRLPASGWQVTFSGNLYVVRPGRYQLHASASGNLRITVDGTDVLNSYMLKNGGAADAHTEPLDLTFGEHPLEIHYVPAGHASLQLTWQSDTFANEPIPAFALQHEPLHADQVDQFPAGRLMVEEHSCISCHAVDKSSPLAASLVARPGPRLTTAGMRLRAAWIYHWLGNPSQFRPEAVMPRMFANHRQGDLERYAVAMFLATQGNPFAEAGPAAADEPATALEPAPLDPAQMDTGHALFQQTGCVVCHEGQAGQPPRATLKRLHQKLKPGALARFLHDPAAIDPSGRMPAFQLTDDQTQLLAAYLTGKDFVESVPLQLPPAPGADELRQVLLGTRATAAEQATFKNLSQEQQILTLGRRVMHARRCANCHEIGNQTDSEDWQPIMAKTELAGLARKRQAGCLAAADIDTHGGVPVYSDHLDRAATAHVLKVVAQPGSTHAPGELARITLERFNCIGCHQRNGSGGLSAELVQTLLTNQTDGNAEAIHPPVLTGVTEKLLPATLHKVLEEDLRARPWMSLQMPSFGKAHLAHLPEGLAALDGHVPSKTKPPRRDPALAETGRTLVGIKGFGCTKCHDMMGRASTGTRGPDLTRVPSRVSMAWFDRWMSDPQRIQPGTRMPTVFLNGESPHKEILGGDPEQQRAAIWQYLLASRGMPLPEGTENEQPLQLAGGNKPSYLRTFLPNVTPRALAIRFPNQINVAYDLQACRLAYAWSGDFLDLGPVWEGRGGSPAALKGPVFWTAPAGFPWDIAGSADHTPDFSGRGTDPAWGADLPHDGQLHPTKVHFHGYQTRGDPRFRYELDLPDGQRASFIESLSTIRQDEGIGLLRDVTVTTPAGQFVWLHVSQADSAPRWRGTSGEPRTLTVEEPLPADGVLLIHQDGQEFILHARDAVDGAAWLVHENAGKWTILLRLPTSGEPAQARVSLLVVQPTGDSQSVWRHAETFGKKGRVNGEE